ncbi:hypothetical protein TWF694_004065 [Orbilia ellipsospora]|uniref:Uncharacterized protein n=1 Tax=Orbilia ellipsospora TaxID=2528407 RepID=A0AAV9WZF2_9PEZI
MPSSMRPDHVIFSYMTMDVNGVEIQPVKANFYLSPNAYTLPQKLRFAWQAGPYFPNNEHLRPGVFHLNNTQYAAPGARGRPRSEHFYGLEITEALVFNGTTRSNKGMRILVHPRNIESFRQRTVPRGNVTATSFWTVPGLQFGFIESDWGSVGTLEESIPKQAALTDSQMSKVAFADEKSSDLEKKPDTLEENIPKRVASVKSQAPSISSANETSNNSEGSTKIDLGASKETFEETISKWIAQVYAQTQGITPTYGTSSNPERSIGTFEKNISKLAASVNSRTFSIASTSEESNDTVRKPRSPEGSEVWSEDAYIGGSD